MAHNKQKLDKRILKFLMLRSDNFTCFGASQIFLEKRNLKYCDHFMMWKWESLVEHTTYIPFNGNEDKKQTKLRMFCLANDIKNAEEYEAVKNHPAIKLYQPNGLFFPTKYKASKDKIFRVINRRVTDTEYFKPMFDHLGIEPDLSKWESIPEYCVEVEEAIERLTHYEGWSILNNYPNYNTLTSETENLSNSLEEKKEKKSFDLSEIDLNSDESVEALYAQMFPDDFKSIEKENIIAEFDDSVIIEELDNVFENSDVLCIKELTYTKSSSNYKIIELKNITISNYSQDELVLKMPFSKREIYDTA